MAGWFQLNSTTSQEMRNEFFDAECGAPRIFSDVSKYEVLVDHLEQELTKWMDALPSYRDLIEETRDISVEIMRRAIRKTTLQLRHAQDEELQAAIAVASAPYAERMRALEVRASHAAEVMDQLQAERLARDKQEGDELLRLKAEISAVKAKFEERQGKVDMSNDRIQALYVKSREFRGILASISDIEKEIEEMLVVNESLTNQKTKLVEELRRIMDELEPSVNQLKRLKAESESRMHILNSKRQTVKRQTEENSRQLQLKVEELRKLTKNTEGLCKQREMWASKLVEIEAEALRDFTPRPDYSARIGYEMSSAVPGGNISPTLGSLLPPPEVQAAPVITIPPLGEYYELRKGMTSAQVVEGSLRKLANVVNATRKSVEEYQRLTAVMQPVIAVQAMFTQGELARGDGESDSISIYANQASMLPMGLLVTADVAESISRGGNAHRSTPIVTFRNEKWSQAATERQAIGMMTAIPQITLGGGAVPPGASPLVVVSEILARWCSAASERDPATGFGANFVTSLRYYSAQSPICQAAYGIVFGQLPVAFGEQVLQHAHSVMSQVDTSAGPLTPMRFIMNALTRLYQKDCLFGMQQVYQIKFAIACDAATSNSLVRIPQLNEITEQKRTSGLFLRTIFSQFLRQYDIVFSSVEKVVFEVAKTSPVLKLSVVSEVAVKSRLDTLKWDGEAIMSNGLRYANAGTGRRTVVLGGKNSLIEHLTQGQSRYDASMLRVFDEAANDTEASSPAGRSKKGDYVAVDPIVAQLRVATFKLVEKQ